MKCTHAFPFVRTCQLCRRLVIRAYYGEAVKRSVRLVILGMNEWAHLSRGKRRRGPIFSAMRKLRPFADKPAVYITHLPFLLQRTLSDTKKIIKKLGWKIPKGEALVASNANSCLLARAAEAKATRLLGFHPDATRLAREVTAGFINKAQAQKALGEVYRSPYSIREILKKAKIL